MNNLLKILAKGMGVVIVFSFSFHAITAMAADPSINCKLKIANLCYNAPYIKNVDGTAQVTSMNRSMEQVSTSEPVNQPRSYALNSTTTRNFIVKNNRNQVFNIKISPRFFPQAAIEYGTAISRSQNLTPLTVSLQPFESKTILVSVPTSQETPSANILFVVQNLDSPVGMSYPYYSLPFTVYNSANPTITCHGYTVPAIDNGPWRVHRYICTNDVFVPLGGIGCTTLDVLPAGQQCINNHKFPSSEQYGTASKVKVLVNNIYFTSNQDVISKNEALVASEIDQLSLKIKRIKTANNSLAGGVSFDRKVCSASPNAIREFLGTKILAQNTDAFLLLCGLSRGDYTQVVLNFYNENLSQTEQNLLATTLQMTNGAEAVNLGNATIYSSIRAGRWPIILHEMTHTFGAPDLYTFPSNYIYGATYNWGDCLLMRADLGSFNQDTPLCPLENAYWSSTISNPPNPTAQIKQAVIPSTSVINSGGNVKLTFTFPANTIRSSLYLSCPKGITTGSINMCNTFINVTSNSDYTVTFFNNSSDNQNVVPNYYIYLPEKPNYATGVSSQITVSPTTTTEKVSVPKVDIALPISQPPAPNPTPTSPLPSVNPTANSTITTNTLSASILSSNEDRAATWGIFKSGIGNANKIAKDWNWQAVVKLSNSKTVKSVVMSHSRYSERWSTNNSSDYPLVIFNEANTQLVDAYGGTFTLSSGTNNLKIFGQMETSTFSGATLTFTFTDGTTLSTDIAPQVSSLNSFSFVANALSAVWNWLKQ